MCFYVYERNKEWKKMYPSLLTWSTKQSCHHSLSITIFISLTLLSTNNQYVVIDEIFFLFNAYENKDIFVFFFLVLPFVVLKILIKYYYPTYYWVCIIYSEYL